MRTLNDSLLERMREYIIEYQKERGLSPSYRNIMKAMNMSSVSLVQRYVLELEKKGLIKRTNLGNIATLPQLRRTGSTMTPLVGEIACGQPVDSFENIEASFALPKALFGDGELFMLRTFGDSMIDIGIKKDDLVVVKKQSTAENGDIVVAMVNGSTTLKRFYRKDGKIILHPENSEMKDIIVKDCEIQGVLVSCIKMY